MAHRASAVWARSFTFFVLLGVFGLCRAVSADPIQFIQMGYYGLVPHDLSGNGAYVIGESNAGEALRLTPEGAADFLGALPFGENTKTKRISVDGGAVIGSIDIINNPNPQAFYWTPATGMQPVGGPPVSYQTVEARALSRDGSTVVGHIAMSGARYAFQWTPTRGLMQLWGLTTSTGELNSTANAVSADGRVVVGASPSYRAADFEAFRWTEADSITGLGFLPGGASSVATHVSSDGSVIAGDAAVSSDVSQTEAFRWTAETGMVSLGVLPGATTSHLVGLSADGNVAVGNSGNEAFRWTPATGMVGLGRLPDDVRTVATHVSANGQVIVGYSDHPNGREYFLWTDGLGLRKLRDMLLADNIFFSSNELTVLAISDDGRTLLGQTPDYGPWLIRIPDSPPVARPGGPYTGVIGQPIQFDGSRSYDPNGDPLTYRWQFSDGAEATGVAPTHAFAARGDYTVTLTVNDGKSDSEPWMAQVSIVNQVPVVNIGGPYQGVRGKPVQFDGSASYDPEGDPIAYFWIFGDGATAFGTAKPSHVYASSGTYEMALFVNDGETSGGSATTTVTITNTVPVANAGGPYAGGRNRAIAFNASGSSDADGHALTHRWNFGDGTTGTGPTPSHAYAASGVYTATLIVNDGEADSATATATVNVTNQAPFAQLSGPATAFKLTPVLWDGSLSFDGDGDVLTYKWSFGDGATTTSSVGSTTYSYASVGSYTVTLVVNDGEANSTPAARTISIQSRPPVANAGPDQTVVQRTTVTLDGSASSDPDGRIVQATWRQVSGPAVALSGANTLSARFIAPKTISGTSLAFELTVTDDDGVQASDQVTVDVVRR
ncbi:MAG: PKD domain-containing protein [Sulfurifustis sp.]